MKTPVRAPFQIFVKTTRAEDGKITLKVNATDTVADVKAKYQDKAGIPTDNACVIFADKQLEEGVPLARFNIGRHSTLLMWWGPFLE